MFFKWLYSLMLHLLLCPQLLFTRLSLPDSELWLQWGGTVLGILWSCGCMSMPLCAFIPWIQNISFCRVAGRAISAQAPGISILHPYSCWVFPLPLQMEMSGRESCTDLMITTTQPLCLKKATSAEWVKGVHISCSSLAFLPSAPLLTVGETLLVGV